VCHRALIQCCSCVGLPLSTKLWNGPSNYKCIAWRKPSTEATTIPTVLEAGITVLVVVPPLPVLFRTPPFAGWRKCPAASQRASLTKAQ